MEEYQMSWWVVLATIIAIIIFGQAMYFSLTQLARVIKQSHIDWGSGKSGVEIQQYKKVDEKDISWIKHEAVSNMFGAVIAGILAAFVISSYGWSGYFLLLGPISALVGGQVCNWCFMVERADDKKNGRLA